jgi:mannosylglycerate hydrolase
MHKKRPDKIYYFAATHWDREWYKTVDEYRFKLIPVMDKILSTLTSDPDFQLFTLDGQTSVLDDYLTVRGESTHADTLRTLIGEGRLLIGPWFTMPDEFLISSESIIQNLIYGHSLCEKYQAETLKVGYVCDTFGHIANLPQIFNGFNIKSAVTSRGTNDHDLDCFFQWKSPDGSEVTAFRAPEICGYGSFFFETISEFYPDYQAHLDEITERAIQYVERELTRTSLPYVILMDGMDHETIHEFMPEVLKRLSEHFQCPVVQQRLDDVFTEINEGMDQLPTDLSNTKPLFREGELTDHCKAYVMHNKLIPHTLSSRYDLKIANDQCQNLLEHYAMPCSAIDEINGSDYIYSYLNYAYSLLLQNHAHDSICGCSIDAVHREMQTRFSKAYQTAAEYFFQYCAKEYFNSVNAVKVEAASSDAGTEEPLCLVKIFNPLPYEYQGAIEFNIDFDSAFEVKSLPYVKFEQRNSFLIFDEDHNELKYNILHASRRKNVKQFGGNKRLADTHRVAVISKLRPLGYTTFMIKPLEQPYRITERFSDSAVSCQNDLIRFEIAPNGTISITDKKTGRIYSGLHSFLDCGEMGDGWFHVRPISDRTISSLGCRVSIEKTFDGYAECKFVVRYEFELPKEKELSFDFIRRSDQYDTCVIKSEFTITRDSSLVCVHTEIDNNIRDHRLQLHLPTNVDTNSYHVNQCNLILSRQTGLDHSHYTWKEADITEQSFESMVFMRSEASSAPHGLLFLSKGGLHEVSCPGDRENSIDITLLRCFNKTVNTDGEPDGQLQGRQEFDYAILPFSDETDSELVLRKDQYVCGYKEFTIPSGAYTQNESTFTFTSDGCNYTTCMPSKKTESSIIVRAVNYSDKPSVCSIRFAKEVTGACICNFLEEVTGQASVNSHVVEVTAEPYQMINVKVSF